jgi:hypothetical protein
MSSQNASLSSEGSGCGSDVAFPAVFRLGCCPSAPPRPFESLSSKGEERETLECDLIDHGRPSRLILQPFVRREFLKFDVNRDHSLDYSEFLLFVKDLKLNIPDSHVRKMAQNNKYKYII